MIHLVSADNFHQSDSMARRAVLAALANQILVVQEVKVLHQLGISSQVLLVPGEVAFRRFTRELGVVVGPSATFESMLTGPGANIDLIRV